MSPLQTVVVGSEKPHRITQISANITRDNWILPALQREFVWDVTSIIAFFESIYEGYPLGGPFYLWDAKELAVDELEKVEGNARSVGQNSLASEGTGFSRRPIAKKQNLYIIDGQQRITALMIGLRNYKIETGADYGAFGFYIGWNGFHMEHKFVRIAEKHQEKNSYFNGGKVFPLAELMEILEKLATHTVEELVDNILAKHPRAFDMQKRGVSPDTPLQVKAILSQLVEMFDLVEFGVKVISNCSHHDVTKIFLTLNKSGKRVTSLESLIVPVFLQHYPSLKKEMTSFRQEIATEYQGTGLEKVISNAFIFLNMKYVLEGYSGVHKLNTDYSTMQIKKAFETSKKGIRQVLHLLNTSLYVKQPSMIPVDYPLHTLVVACGRFLDQEGKTYLPESMVNSACLYFLTSNLNNRFSGKNNVRHREEDMLSARSPFADSSNPFSLLAEAVEEYSCHGPEKNWWVDVEKLEKVKYGKTVGEFYLSLLAMVLKENKAPSFKNGNSSIDTTQGYHKHHIFPRAAFKDQSNKLNETFKDSIFNITYVHKEINEIEFKDKLPEEYFPELFKYESDPRKISESLKQHLMPAGLQLTSANFEHFIEYRKSEMARAMDSFIKKFADNK